MWFFILIKKRYLYGKLKLKIMPDPKEDEAPPVPTDPRHGITSEDEVDPTVEPTEPQEGEEEAPKQD